MRAIKQAGEDAKKNRPGYLNKDFDGKDAKSLVAETLGISTDESKPGLFDSFKKQVLEPQSISVSDTEASEPEKEKKGFSSDQPVSTKADDVSEVEKTLSKTALKKRAKFERE